MSAQRFLYSRVFLGERGIFIGAIMHISPIESADIASLPVTCKGRGL